MIFLAFTAAIIIVLSIALFLGGTAHTVRLAWMCSLLVPVWMTRNVGALTIDLRIIVFVLMLLIAVAGGRYIRKLNLIDGLMTLLVAVGILSLYRSDLLAPSETLRVLSVWVVPYIFGRLLIQRLDDLDRLVPWACGVCLVLSSLSLFESVTRVNPVNVVAGRYGSSSAESYLRMNLRRAEGTQTHPIFFGLTIAMLFPWSLEGARRAMQNQLPKIFVIVPVCCVFGVLGTMSRGPFLVLFGTGIAALFFYKPVLRIPLVVAAIASIAIAVLSWSSVINTLEDISGEETAYSVTINEKSYAYSGTKHRELLFLVYANAMDAAGWIGHGKWGDKISHRLYLEPQLRTKFRSIDNEYIIMRLDWGLLGVGLLGVLGLVCVVTGTNLAFKLGDRYRVLLGGLAGAIAAMMLIFFSVWIASDFGFVWLSMIGMLSSCNSALATEKERARTRISPLRQEGSDHRITTHELFPTPIHHSPNRLRNLA